MTVVVKIEVDNGQVVSEMESGHISDLDRDEILRLREHLRTLDERLDKYLI